MSKLLFNYEAVEKIIGYEFNDKNLLKAAFTHKSYSNEHKNAVNYERLEFLGDSILGFFVTDYLYRTDSSSEGSLSSKKSKMVSSIPLATVLFNLGLDKYILFGNGFKADSTKKFCEDVFEALTAAIYLDGGISKAWSFVNEMLIDSPYLESSFELTKDYKSIIKEFVEKNHLGELCYKEINRSGPEHNLRFMIALCINDEEIAIGEDSSKHKAEQSAAKIAVYKLKKRGYKLEF